MIDCDLDPNISLPEAVTVHLSCFLIHYLWVYVIINNVSLIQHLMTVSSKLQQLILDNRAYV